MDTFPLTLHLQGWEPDRAIRAAANVAELMEHPGFEDLCEAMLSAEQGIQLLMMTGKASDSAADYADKVGQMKGLRAFRAVAQGVVDNGLAVEAEMKTEEVA